MIDGYMLLAPLVVLPIVLLFAFVGCGLTEFGELEPVTVTLLFFDPPKIYWPAAAKITFDVTIVSETLTYKETQNASSTFLEQPPASFPLEMSLFFDAPPGDTLVFDCHLGLTGFDASGIKIGSALPPCYPGPCKKTRWQNGTHWSFKVQPTDLQSGANKIVKIVET